jgi:hypothetical protein
MGINPPCIRFGKGRFAVRVRGGRMQEPVRRLGRNTAAVRRTSDVPILYRNGFLARASYRRYAVAVRIPADGWTEVSSLSAAIENGAHFRGQFHD